MQKITISVPHQLTRAEARRRIEAQAAQVQQQYGGTLGRLDHHWNGDTMNFTVHVMGMAVPGSLQVEDQAVRVEVELPWLLAKLAGGIQAQIEQQGRRLLDNKS